MWGERLIYTTEEQLQSGSDGARRDEDITPHDQQTLLDLKPAYL